MIVKFYILQENTETGKTRDKYLFKAEHEEMYVDKEFIHLETKYKVKSLEWEDMILKAVCLEM